MTITALDIINAKDEDQACSLFAQHTKEFIYNSVSPSTRKFYRIDFNIFRVWCESVELPYMPALPSTLAAFLSSQELSGIKPSTLVRRLAAIKMAHKAFGCQTPTDDHFVKATMKGIRRTKGMAQNKKAPATAERLEMMVSKCPDIINGLRDKALLLLGFAGAFRRSELVALTTADIERTPEGMKVIIRKSKGDQEGKGQTVAILEWHPLSCCRMAL